MYYFDNAATTYPKPASVRNAVINAMTNYGGNPGRGGHDMAMKVSEQIYLVRSQLAKCFHAELQNVIFTQNCTMSLNMAIKGILKEGDHVITSCLEHNSVIRPIEKLHQDGIITYDIAKVYEDDDEETVRSFKHLINDNTRAIVCTHASNVSGAVLPIRKLGQLCKKYHLIFIVDAAQTAGVFDIDMQECNINLLCMPGHKGLYGIGGTGVLILNGVSDMDTLMEGGTGSLSALLEQPTFTPDRFEAGTVNTPGIFSLGAGLEFIDSVGREKIYRHEYGLCKHVYDVFSETDGIILYNKSYETGRVAPILSFNLKKPCSEEVAEELNRRNFALRGGLHCSPLAHIHYKTKEKGMVRFAPSVFSKEWETDQFIQNVQTICKNMHG